MGREDLCMLCYYKKWSEAEEWLGQQSHHDIKSALEFKADYGLTALHLACIFEAPLSLVRWMVAAAPNATKLGNENGSLPLHYAAYVGAPVEILQVLFEANKQATTTKGWNGHTPLFRALHYGRYLNNAEAIRILTANGAAAIGDSNGKLPIVVANEKGTNGEVITIKELLY